MKLRSLSDTIANSGSHRNPDGHPSPSHGIVVPHQTNYHRQRLRFTATSKERDRDRAERKETKRSAHNEEAFPVTATSIAPVSESQKLAPQKTERTIKSLSGLVSVSY